MPMLTPAPAPLRRARPRHLRHPLPQAERPAPRPAFPDDTLNLDPQAVVGALFRSPTPEKPGKRERQKPEKDDEPTGVTLPPRRFPSRTHGQSGRHLSPAEKEFLVLFGMALCLGGGALFLGQLSRTDLLLAGVVLLSGLGLLAFGYSARRSQPTDE
jgi:hypothetical protein